MTRFKNSADHLQNNKPSGVVAVKAELIRGEQYDVGSPRHAARQRYICGQRSDRPIISVFMGPGESGR